MSHHTNCLIKALAILMLLLSSCQSESVAPLSASRCTGTVLAHQTEVKTGLVPEVIGTLPIQMSSSSQGIVVVNPCTGYVYVAGSKHVTILKGAEVIGEIETQGSQIVSMAVDEMNDLVYVVDEYDNVVTVLHGKKIIGIVPTTGHRPTKVFVEPHNRLAYIVSGYRQASPQEDPVEGNILVLNGTQIVQNLQVSGRILLRDIVSDPTNDYVYASGSKNVVVFKGLQEIARHNLKESVDSMDVNPRTGEVYALTHQTLYRFKQGNLIDAVELSPTMGTVWQIRVHPITGAVYIPRTGYVRGEARIMVVQSMKVIEDIEVGGLATLAIDPLTGNVYAAIFGEGKDQHTVTIIQGTQVTTKIKAGWYPYNIGVNPYNGWVYVSNINEGTVTVLGYPQNQSIVPVPTETIPVTPKTPPTPAVYP